MIRFIITPAFAGFIAMAAASLLTNAANSLKMATQQITHATEN